MTAIVIDLLVEPYGLQPWWNNFQAHLRERYLVDGIKYPTYAMFEDAVLRDYDAIVKPSGILIFSSEKSYTMFLLKFL